MKSSARSEPLDLARDLPTTAEDIEALRRAKRVRPMTTEDYLSFLKQLPQPSPDELRARRGPRADRPFVISG